jgi:hypothetical protein
MEVAHNSGTKSFTSWLFSTQELLEKTVGFVALLFELSSLTMEMAQAEKPGPRRLLTEALNLFFLLFIYFFLKNHFNKKFSINADSKTAIDVLGLDENDKLGELVAYANTLTKQLSNFNGFILSTAFLYAVLIVQYLLKDHGLEPDWVKDILHYLTDLVSYIAAFFLLRCFFVMFLSTIDANGNDILDKQTHYYIWVGLGLMLLDIFIIHFNPEHGPFIAEFICGSINAIVFILFIARFENKRIDIPPFVLCILYLYAVLQTFLPLVTGSFKAEEGMEEFLHKFSSVIFTLCLLGKIVLVAVVSYALTSKKFFYYFITYKKLFDEEQNNWKKFEHEIKESFPDTESFNITYLQRSDGKYQAVCSSFFGSTAGIGQNPNEAKEDLLQNVRTMVPSLI